MVKENNCLIERNMSCGDEIEITLNPGEIFKEEVLDFGIDDIGKNNSCLNNETSVNFIIIILAFLILRDMSM